MSKQAGLPDFTDFSLQLAVRTLPTSRRTHGQQTYPRLLPLDNRQLRIPVRTSLQTNLFWKYERDGTATGMAGGMTVYMESIDKIHDD